jgi:hypothetical protein
MANPWLSGNGLSHAVAEETGVPISRQTVNRVRHWIHFTDTTPRTRAKLSDDNVEKRLSFCQKVLETLSAIDWSADVVISDESRFGLYEDSRKMWVARGVDNAETFNACPKYTQSVMVCGAIGLGYKSPLVFIDGTLDAARYQAMLESNHILEDITTKCAGRQMWFQQDGAPAHRAKSTIQFIQQKINLVNDWPVNSPDLSVIENVWGIMKNKIAARNPKSIGELRKYLCEEWDALDQATLDGLIRSIPERCRLCIHHGGECISVYWKRRSPIGDVASPPEGVLTARTIRAEHIDRIVQWRGVITQMHAIHGKKCFRLQDEPAFTPAGSIPRSILVIAEADAHVSIVEEPVVIEGEVGLLRGKPLNASQRALKLPLPRTVALTMIIRFQRVMKQAKSQRTKKRRDHVEEKCDRRGR